jgi:hypothetical protein
MLFAKRRTSLLSQDTSWGGYSKPAPGPLILIVLSELNFKIVDLILWKSVHKWKGLYAYIECGESSLP